MGWANHLLSFKHPKFMETFEQWLSERQDTRLAKEKIDVATLYATAFEFTAIGATAVSGTRQKLFLLRLRRSRARFPGIFVAQRNRRTAHGASF